MSTTDRVAKPRNKNGVAAMASAKATARAADSKSTQKQHTSTGMHMMMVRNSFLDSV
jgi:hypothetical protein